MRREALALLCRPAVTSSPCGGLTVDTAGLYGQSPEAARPFPWAGEICEAWRAERRFFWARYGALTQGFLGQRRLLR